MVPGEFKTVNPFLKANPERGRICASYPTGSSRNKLVGTKVLSNDFKTIGESRFARKSIPADAFVAYDGSGCFDLLIILIFIFLSE